MATKERLHEFDRLHPVSRRIYEEAKSFTTEGVHWRGQYMSSYPIYIVGGEGARIFDVDGNSYIDYSMGHGPLLIGSSPSPCSRKGEGSVGRESIGKSFL